MSLKKRFLVTMALPYANGDIHLGHVLEAVQTDIFVRFQRLRGHEAVFVCADDTHGTPIELSALKRGITPETLIAEAYESHRRDYAGFAIGFDIFYTTNSPENRRYAELIYNNLIKDGLIIEKEIDQYYCEHDRRFLPDRFITGACPQCGAQKQYGDVCEACGATYDPTEIVEPRCVICNGVPVMRRSTHFYVQLGKCETFLREYINREGVLQDDMRNFVTTWINEGLREWCISRDGPYFGFAIPGTKDKYFYVWLDAPIGYISSTDRWCNETGRAIGDYWSPQCDTEVVHFIGKDIVYFHTLFWPVMLKSSSFKLPGRFFIHGFINVKGEKMSKSRGTFIHARDYLEKIRHPQAAEFLRFYYGSKLMPNAGDLDLNAEELMSRVNTTLANNIGNLHHRTAVFCDRSFGGMVPDAPWDEAIAAEVEAAAAAIEGHFDRGEYKLAVERIHALGNRGNKYYQDGKPWELVKSAPQNAAVVMVTCVNLMKALAVFLKPVVPALSGRIERKLGMTLAWNDYAFSLRNIKMGPTEKLVRPLETADLEPLFGASVNESPAAEDASAPDDLIDIDTFGKVQLKVADVVAAEPVPKSKKLLRLQIELGAEKRQIVAGIAVHYTPESIVGKQIVVVANLKPAKLCGEVSQGMVLAAKNADGSLVVVSPERQGTSGARVA
ncbi:MAG: methionine--tRNA ligase [Chitinispirillaceae bacterium]|nr:methionine--tRNA ligase [Chitinispirillaceae bacterium]